MRSVNIPRYIPCWITVSFAMHGAIRKYSGESSIPRHGKSEISFFFCKSRDYRKGKAILSSTHHQRKTLASQILDSAGQRTRQLVLDGDSTRMRRFPGPTIFSQSSQIQLENGLVIFQSRVIWCGVVNAQSHGTALFGRRVILGGRYSLSNRGRGRCTLIHTAKMQCSLIDPPFLLYLHACDVAM